MSIDVKHLDYFGVMVQFQLIAPHLLLRTHKNFSASMVNQENVERSKYTTTLASIDAHTYAHAHTHTHALMLFQYPLSITVSVPVLEP